MTSITRSFPWFIKDFGISVIGDECYTSLVENLDVSDVACLKYSLSKGLGIGIVIGGTVMKLPQLLLILNARSARGISLAAYVLESLAYAITLAYAFRNLFPFSTYETSKACGCIADDDHHLILSLSGTFYHTVVFTDVHAPPFPLFEASTNSAEHPLALDWTAICYRRHFPNRGVSGSSIHYSYGNWRLINLGWLCAGTAPKYRPRCTVVDVLGNG